MNNRTSDEIYEILMAQLPKWFKPVLEYIAIMKAYSAELANFESDAATIYSNQYIQTCDATTLQYWERLLGLTYNVGDTLTYRRQRILMYFNQTVPYTVWHLIEDMTNLYGTDFSLEVDEEECWIKITVTSDIYGAVTLLHNLIFKWVPAHLYVYANQQVANYVTSGAYHAAVMTRTFEQTIGTGGN